MNQEVTETQDLQLIWSIAFPFRSGPSSPADQELVQHTPARTADRAVVVRVQGRVVVKKRGNIHSEGVRDLSQSGDRGSDPSVFKSREVGNGEARQF